MYILSTLARRLVFLDKRKNVMMTSFQDFHLTSAITLGTLVELHKTAEQVLFTILSEAVKYDRFELHYGLGL